MFLSTSLSALYPLWVLSPGLARPLSSHHRLLRWNHVVAQHLWPT